MTNKNLTIFLVDDDPDFIDFVRHSLKSEPYNLFVMDHPEEILKEVKNCKPDLILLDLNYHVGSKSSANSNRFVHGEAFMPVKERHETLKDVPLLFCTSDKKFVQEINVQFVGAKDSILKPINPADLQTNIQSSFN